MRKPTKPTRAKVSSSMPHRVLDAAAVKMIRANGYPRGRMSHRELARLHEVSRTTIYKVLAGRRFTWLEDET